MRRAMAAQYYKKSKPNTVGQLLGQYLQTEKKLGYVQAFRPLPLPLAATKTIATSTDDSHSITAPCITTHTTANHRSNIDDHERFHKVSACNQQEVHVKQYDRRHTKLR